MSQPAGHDYRVPVPEFVKQILNRTAGVLRKVLPYGWGFTLLIFEYQDAPGGRMSYISSAQRADMVRAMQEFIKLQSNS